MSSCILNGPNVNLSKTAGWVRLFLFVMIVISSCGPGRKAIEPFGAARNNVGLMPRLNGLYYSYETIAPRTGYFSKFENKKIDTLNLAVKYLWFFGDSTLFTEPDLAKAEPGGSYGVDSNYLSHLTRSIVSNSGSWGIYRSIGDTIETLVFMHDPQRMNRWIPVKQVYLNKAGILLLLYEFCPLCKGNYYYWNSDSIVYEAPRKYAFVPFSSKPDSTIGATNLKNKKWYRQAREIFLFGSGSFE